MTASHSPLRYPGGKQILGKVLGHLIERNAGHGANYAEPYAGGAGAALQLLFEDRVERICINDYDSRIFAFWWSMLNEPIRFLERLKNIPVTVQEWRQQRTVYLNEGENERFDVGFATFFLNRCNRSGIIGNGGVIGGLDQAGNYKIDARFNRDELARRIKRIQAYRDRIELSNLDAIDFLTGLSSRPDIAPSLFVYLDPPYYAKGQQLYLNYYRHADHEKLARYLLDDATFDWVLTYDKAPEIQSLYSSVRQVAFRLGYSARGRRNEREIMILKPELDFPKSWLARVPDEYVSSSDKTRLSLGDIP